MDEPRYLYALIPPDAPEGTCGAIEALLLAGRIPATWQNLPDGRVYRIEVATGCREIDQLLGYLLVRDVRQLGIHRLIGETGWTPVKRAHGRVPRGAAPPVAPTEGAWSCFARKKGQFDGDWCLERVSAEEAVYAYGRAVEEKIHPEGIEHWQPRRAESRTWIVYLEGPAAEPIP